MKATGRKAGAQTTFYMTRISERHRSNANYADLPLRDHEQIAATASRIEHGVDADEREELQTNSGINGESCLLGIDSLIWPWCFPIDIMHVLYENIMPQLLALWQGTYKTGQTLGSSKAKHQDAFVIPKGVWATIAKEISKSNHTTPAQTAPRVGNITKKSFWTAETYSYFLMFLGPVVLKGRLPAPYYAHFILFSEIAKRMTSQEISYQELPVLHSKIVVWVKAFE
ncbi:hypothetical protein QFC22_006659, partial [Naganishia vaughanmartiniae]